MIFNSFFHYITLVKSEVPTFQSSDSAQPDTQSYVLNIQLITDWLNCHTRVEYCI